jgi:hypothetical protein
MTPGAYRTSPDPVEAEDLVSEGLTAVPDDLSRARLLMTRASCARLWKGSEPFGPGSQFDPTPVEVRIRAVDEAMATAGTSRGPPRSPVLSATRARAWTMRARIRRGSPRPVAIRPLPGSFPRPRPQRAGCTAHSTRWR